MTNANGRKKIQNRVTAQIAEYLPQFQKYGDNPLATFQEPKLQELRFEKLMGSILNVKDLEAFSLYDVGCGPGHLHQYLNNQNVPHTYSGSDLVTEVVKLAKQKFPKANIECADFIQNDPKGKYDFVVCNGLLHFPAGVPKEEWKEFAFNLIKKMFNLATKGIAFNFLTTYKTTDNPALAYFDPLELFDFCQKNMSRFVTIDHAYALYEVTMTVYTKNFMRALYSDDAFKKYFVR